MKKLNTKKQLSNERFDRIDKFVQDAFLRYEYDEEKLRRYFGNKCPTSFQERELYCNRLLNLPNDVKCIILNKYL